MQSKLSLKLRSWQEIIMVTQILERKPKSSMKICDQFGREHKLEYADFSLFEWESIGLGSKIKLYVQESVAGIEVIVPELPEGLDWENIPIPGFLWWCPVCGKSDVISYEEGDEPSRVVEHIYEAHQGASPDCSSANVRVFDHHFVEQTGLAQMIAQKIVKT